METRDAFVDAAATAVTLIGSPAVAEAWPHESACTGMSVGGLANHLAAQVLMPVEMLAGPPGDAEPITLEEHYRRAAWVTAPLDAEVNVAIREGSDEKAAAGPDSLAARLEEAMRLLPRRLAESRDPDTVHLPWQGWTLTVPDFLVSRTMEIVVHSDDLAASVGQPTPEFARAVLDPVLALLTSIAVRRHGQAAVVRTLTRPQRAPATVTAF